MKVKKIFAVAAAMMLTLTMMSVAVEAAIPTNLPDGVLKVVSADKVGTRDKSWKKDGIITLPQGDAFDNGGTNHGIYSIDYACKNDDTFYTYWIIKVEKTDSAEDSAILSNDPAWKNGGTELSTGTSGYLIEDDYTEEIFYEDITPDKWCAVPCGYKVENEECNKVELRLHYKNVASVQFKYLVITSKPMNFNLNTETGEIDGVTNENAYVAATATATPESTPTPTVTTAPATTAPATTTAATATTTTTAAVTTTAPKGNDGGNTGLIIGIVGGVVVVGGIAAFVLLKKKK